MYIPLGIEGDPFHESADFSTRDTWQSKLAYKPLLNL